MSREVTAEAYYKLVILAQQLFITQKDHLVIRWVILEFLQYLLVLGKGWVVGSYEPDF